MPIIGSHTLLDNALPSGIDTQYVLNFQSRDGLTGAEIVGLAATLIGQANNEIIGFYGGLLTLTEELYASMEVGDGSRSMTPKATEFAKEDGVVGEEIAHMLFVDKYKDAVGWSVEWLREARREKIVASLNLIRNRWRNRVDYDVVWRLLSAAEVRVGNTGYAPGWAIGTGTNTNYVPPQWMTEVFDSTHTHYKRTNAAATAANTLSALESGAEELSHHGHVGDKVAFVSNNLAKLLTSSNDKRIALYVPSQFRMTAGNSSSQIVSLSGIVEGVPGETVAWVNTDAGLVEVKRHPRFPAGYLWLGKSYGQLNALNPLAVRTDPLWGGFGLTINPITDRSLQPKLEMIEFEAKHGVNVNDRTNGYAHQIAAGSDSYENPTIQG